MLKKLQYAIKNNKIVSIDEVESGIKCGCICPACGNALIAKKGKIKIHHFAHSNSEECKGSIETSIHMLAKEILSEEMNMMLPPVYLDFGPSSYKEKELIYEKKIIKFDKIYLEKKLAQ